MSSASTVPGAIATLSGYLEQIAAANPALGVATSIGWPLGTVPNNWIMVGSFAADGGNIVEGGMTDWTGLPAARRSEDYGINLSIVTWDGNVDPVSRLADAYTLLDGLYAAITADVGAGGSLTPTGAWGSVETSVPVSGPFTDSEGNSSGGAS